MSKGIAVFVLLLVAVPCFAGEGFVTLADSTKLFFVKDNEVYSPDKKQLLYIRKGNIFFTGNADERQNIYLMATSLNPGSDKLESLIEKDNRDPSYSFMDNKFYAGKLESEDLRERSQLLYATRAGKWIALYASSNDSLLAYYPADSLPGAITVLTAYTLSKKYNLEEKLQVKQQSLPYSNQGFVTLKPSWGNVTANEWMWDGQVFRPRWNVDPRLTWTFDGQTVKPLYGNNIYEQYSWDGETFKPIWRSSRTAEWTYDGRIFKPTWDTDWANQYTIENGVIKPWSNVHPEKEWQVDGDLPLPLIILVISGIAKSY